MKFTIILTLLLTAGKIEGKFEHDVEHESHVRPTRLGILNTTAHESKNPSKLRGGRIRELEHDLRTAVPELPSLGNNDSTIDILLVSTGNSERLPLADERGALWERDFLAVRGFPIHHEHELKKKGARLKENFLKLLRKSERGR